MGYDGRSYRKGFNGSSTAGADMTEYWKGKGDRATADAIGGALQSLGDSLGRMSQSPNYSTPAPIQRVQAAPLYPQATLNRVATTLPSYGSYEPRRSRRPGILRFGWWKEETLLCRLTEAGDVLTQGSWLHAVVGAICAIATCAFFLSHPQSWSSQSQAVPYWYGLIGGIAAAAGVWLLGKVLHFAAIILAGLAFTLSWGLLLASIVAVLYASVTWAVRSGLFR